MSYEQCMYHLAIFSKTDAWLKNNRIRLYIKYLNVIVVF